LTVGLFALHAHPTSLPRQLAKDAENTLPGYQEPPRSALMSEFVSRAAKRSLIERAPNAENIAQ
jgi:hypothetical protein